MPAEAPRSARSLTWRLIYILALPMLAVALALGIGGALTIRQSVEAVNDRILAAASRAIAESLVLDNGQISLDLSPAIFGMLESNARDNVYYNVRHGGVALTGYQDLPNLASPAMPAMATIFRNGEFRGRPIRAVIETRRLPGLSEPVIIQVAETLDARNRIIRRLLFALAALEIGLLGLMVMLLPRAVRWGVSPVAALSAEMDRRAASDLAALPTSGVPSELQVLVRAFNGMLARLELGLEGMRRFTADASHQMRTPLSVLRGHVTLLRQANVSDENMRGSIDDIGQATERLSHLLIQLLALARADSATTDPMPLGSVDLARIARDACGEHSILALRRDVELQLSLDHDPVMAHAHPVLAAELLGNLIDNAIRYNQPGGHVHVHLGRDEKRRVVATVEDDGPGIPEADRERVFTRFSRLDRDRTRHQAGSGLGLPIARSLADAMGASLELTSATDGRGLRVILRFAPLTA